MLGHGEIGRHLVELHGLHACRLVLAGTDDIVLDGVVDLAVGNDRRRHAGGRERARPDRRALHAHLEPFDVGQRAHRLVDEDVAHAAAGIADQHHVGFFCDLIGDGCQHVGIQHLVPVVEVAEQEGRIDERRGLREGRHVRWGDDAVVDGFALRHVLEILLLQSERGVLVQHEINRLAVVFLDQFLEADERLGKSVVVVELDRAVEGDVLRLRRHRVSGSKHRRAQRSKKRSWFHMFPPGEPASLTDVPSFVLGPGVSRGHDSARQRGKPAMVRNASEIFCSAGFAGWNVGQPVGHCRE